MQLYSIDCFTCDEMLSDCSATIAKRRLHLLSSNVTCYIIEHEAVYNLQLNVSDEETQRLSNNLLVCYV